MKLEEKLVSLRKAKGLSQMKLAEKMNVSRQAISRWETGAAIPSSENLKYLSDLYSVSLDYLLSDSADAPEQNRRISNEPDGEMVTISDSADGGKKGKQKTAKWLAILMVVVALIKVVVTVNGEPIYQKEVDTVVNQSPNIKISESEVITNSINQLVVVQYGKKNGCSASQEEIDQQLNEYENSYPTIYDSALDLFGEDGLRKGIEYRIIYEKTKEYVFDLFWSEHTSVDEQSVIDFCSQKGVNYSDLSNNDRELATDAYTNFLQQDYFLEFQESLVDSAEIIY